MTKIIFKGEDPADQERVTLCVRCKTQFSFMGSEARSTQDRNGAALVVDCPLCKHPVWTAI